MAGWWSPRLAVVQQAGTRQPPRTQATTSTTNTTATPQQTAKQGK